jgi:hypothetical protein
MMMKLFASAAFAAAITVGAGIPAEAASTCKGVARHMASGSVVVDGAEPVRIVPARRGRCLLILSGWTLEQNSPPEAGASAGVNIGDENVTADGATGGFVPNGASMIELATEDEVWAVERETHPDQIVTWIELYD